MNRPIIIATATMVILAASAFALQSIQMAKAQYGGTTGGGSLEEQLKLARAKITNAHAAGAYGSGTPMLGTNINETTIFIIVIVAVFGGVAAAFFIKSRSGAKAKATA
ncbi:MAG: hypothetical protein JO327_10110 [Nitrososphaeraceae archaeon]|nr:hypothetical protein [Nitrososphaeraceae archaeon]